MALMVSDSGGGDFKVLPEGTHVAACFLVADIGLQEGYQGKAQHKIVVGWETPEEIIDTEDGPKPMIIYSVYTASLSEKAYLRQDLESWRGRSFTEDELKGFDVFNVLGAPCLVTVVHNTTNGKTFANVKSVAALPKGMAKAPPTRTIKYSEEDTQQWNDLPEWIQKKIEGRIKVEPASGYDERNPPPEEFDDDVPF